MPSTAIAKTCTAQVSSWAEALWVIGPCPLVVWHGGQKFLAKPLGARFSHRILSDFARQKRCRRNSGSVFIARIALVQ